MEMPVNISEPGYFGHKIFSSIRRTLQRRARFWRKERRGRDGTFEFLFSCRRWKEEGEEEEVESRE